MKPNSKLLLKQQDCNRVPRMSKLPILTIPNPTPGATRRIRFGRTCGVAQYRPGAAEREVVLVIKNESAQAVTRMKRGSDTINTEQQNICGFDLYTFWTHFPAPLLNTSTTFNPQLQAIHPGKFIIGVCDF